MNLRSNNIFHLFLQLSMWQNSYMGHKLVFHPVRTLLVTPITFFFVRLIRLNLYCDCVLNFIFAKPEKCQKMLAKQSGNL